MDHGTEAEHRHAEALFAHGELAAAEPLIRRLLGLYTYAGYRHRRGWAYARLAAIHQAHGRGDLALQANVNAPPQEWAQEWVPGIYPNLSHRMRHL